MGRRNLLCVERRALLCCSARRGLLGLLGLACLGVAWLALGIVGSLFGSVVGSSCLIGSVVVVGPEGL